MANTPGLRERKKEQTRHAIANAALRLFHERGFDAVTVAEVASAADVSVQTVFNHFPTKEDLVYDQTTSVEEQLLQTVHERPVGESVLAAVGRFWLERFDRIGATDATAGLATMARLVEASPALQARERQILARYRDSLATLIANETGATAGDLEPRVAAGALVDLQRVLLDAAREKVLLGRRGARLARELRSEGERVLALLERGLGRYAISTRR
jgi:AcrR family transcriptional regulator